MTVVRHAGGGARGDALFDGGFLSPSGKAVLFRQSPKIPGGYAAYRQSISKWSVNKGSSASQSAHNLALEKRYSNGSSTNPARTGF